MGFAMRLTSTSMVCRRGCVYPILFAEVRAGYSLGLDKCHINELYYKRSVYHE